MATNTKLQKGKWKPSRRWRTPAGMALVAALLVAVLALAAACGGGNDGGQDRLISEGAVAPEFTLPVAGGKPVSLKDYTAERNVLLYFSMGSG